MCVYRDLNPTTQPAAAEPRPQYVPHTMPSFTRRLFLISLSSAPWALSKSWDDPTFPSWSPEFIDKLHTDSPWAKPSTVRVELDAIQRIVEPSSSFVQIELPAGIGLPRTGSPIPGVGWPTGGSRTGTGRPPTTGSSTGGDRTTGGTRAEIFLTTRWASALPIRRARALQQFGRDGLESDGAVELLKTPSEYVVEIAGFPTTIIRQGGERFAEELKESARLASPGRKSLAATSCKVPPHGMHLMATLAFPRFEGLDPKEGYIELSATLRGIELHERFKLKQMIYSGNLEL